MFKGYINKPGDEAKLPIALWAFRYNDTKTGEIETGYSGTIVATNIPAADQIEARHEGPSGSDVAVANLTLRPGQIVLFANSFKDEASEKDRPGSPPFRPSVWIKKFEDSGRPYLSGPTQYPIPGSEAEQLPTLVGGRCDHLPAWSASSVLQRAASCRLGI